MCLNIAHNVTKSCSVKHLFTLQRIAGLRIPYSENHWWHKTLANCQNIVLANKTLANAPLASNLTEVQNLVQNIGKT